MTGLEEVVLVGVATVLLVIVAYCCGYERGKWDALVKEWDEKLGVKR